MRTGRAATSSDRIELGRVVPVTYAEGPGRRTAVWVQGCSLRCRGCFNPALWPEATGREVLVTDIVAGAVEAAVEGVTVLGGEPFDRPAPVARLAEAFRAEGLGVVVFTGHTVEHLRRAGRSQPDIARVLAATDLLVDGPFLAHRVDTVRPWVGSTNQRFHALTGRYADVAAAPGAAHSDLLEIRVRPDGATEVNGWAVAETLDRLLHGI